ncbi:MAG: FAD-binding protein [Phycisphaerales bacterium]|nr:FAD-binding protein [Phycisphaerales bacterium]
MGSTSLPVISNEPSAMMRHAAALRDLIRGQVRFDRHDRMLYSTDASIYQVEPLGVVVPADDEDVETVVRYAREHDLPVLPRGGGTSLAGQCVNSAIVIDTSVNLRSLGWVCHSTKCCMVGAGMTIDDLNDELRPEGLFFAPDPATARQANIGGCIGNNAAGTRSIKYGRTVENVEAVHVVLSTGERITLARGAAGCGNLRGIEIPPPVQERMDRDRAIARRLTDGVIDVVRRHERLIRERYPKTRRRNAGYALDMILADLDEAQCSGSDPLDEVDLAKLICGSEGTLAFVTAANLWLHPVPRSTGLAVIGFASLEQAIDAVVPLLTLNPSAVELLDDLILNLANENAEYRQYVQLMPQPLASDATHAPALRAVLYVEFQSEQGTGEIEDRFAELHVMIPRQFPGASVACYSDRAAIMQALKLRKAGEPLLHGIPGRRKPVGFVEDNSVPVERLSEFVREFRRIVESRGTIASFYAHASVGVLHVRPLLDLRDAADRKRMEEIAIETADLAQSLGGVMSGEHGDGRARGPLLERFYGRELMNAFREIKQVFDPHNLFNPGNIVAPGPIASIHESTRVQHEEQSGGAAHLPEMFFDYSREGGFDHAVELCNGAGVCRKKTGGTMCPSYMASLDERHCTRGRGNALRLAISGQFGQRGKADWNDASTLETLDLCLSCKACKTECPSNVDVAKYKAEYLAQSYRDAGRIPLAARLLGRVDRLNRLGSWMPAFANTLADSPPIRAIVNRLLGLAPQRSLPHFAHSLFRQALDFRATADGSAPAVILYGDCFTAFNEPHIGLAAMRLLDAFGYRVIVADAGCCGRAMISTGLLDQAHRTIAATAGRLSSLVSAHQARAVLVCEPSCLASIHDEWQTLRLAPSARVHAQSIAPRAWLVEDFLERFHDAHPRRPQWAPRASGHDDGRILLHGHCHQKALWGVDTSAAILRRLFGPRLHVLDTGCCGMAGSFGYAAHRYDLSMKIGELALFPAVRQLSAGDVVLAPGTSCRHQVHDGAGAAALHPLEFLARSLRQ